MIRFVHCIKRRQEISISEFRRFWNSEELKDLTLRLFDLLQPVRKHYALVLAVEANQDLMRERGGAEPFDAMMEFWFENAQRFEQLSTDSEYLRLRAAMESLLAPYVDFSRSARFFTEWED